MKKVITVTLNPSLDRTVVVHYLNLGYQNRTVGETRLEPAGRAMNIAEGLYSLQSPVEALILLGNDPNSKAYESLISNNHGFPIKIIRMSGAIRSNMFIVDSGNNQETIIKESGADISPDDMQTVSDAIEAAVSADCVVAFAGSLPAGADEDAFVRLIQRAKDKGAQVMLHTDSEYLGKALIAKPDIVAINQLQAESYFNFPVRVEDEVLYCARQLLDQGAGTALVALADHRGVIGLTNGEACKVETNTESQLGAYSGSFSAFLAGYLAAQAQAHPLDESLAMGWASAVFTANQVGNTFATPAELAPYRDDIIIEALDLDA